MSIINIQISGVGTELALGTYMPKDTTIFNDWTEFYHYNDLIHESHLIVEHVSELIVLSDNKMVYKGKLPVQQVIAQQSFSPVLTNKGLYLRTECAEKAVYECQFETSDFDISKLKFETQDYDYLFKVGSSFLNKIIYEKQVLHLEWKNANPVGNICLLCRYDSGYLVPIYDAVNKMTTNA